jgi:hypothetical protein
MKVSGVIGLEKNPSNPAASALSRSPTSPNAVRARMGHDVPAAPDPRIAASAAYPSITGMCRSIRIRSGGDFSLDATASSPFLASVASCPRARTRYPRRSNAGSASSTMSTCAINDPSSGGSG